MLAAHWLAELLPGVTMTTDTSHGFRASAHTVCSTGGEKKTTTKNT